MLAPETSGGKTSSGWSKSSRASRAAEKSKKDDAAVALDLREPRHVDDSDGEQTSVCSRNTCIVEYECDSDVAFAAILFDNHMLDYVDSAQSCLAAESFELDWCQILQQMRFPTSTESMMASMADRASLRDQVETLPVRHVNQESFRAL